MVRSRTADKPAIRFMQASFSGAIIPSGSREFWFGEDFPFPKACYRFRSKRTADAPVGRRPSEACSPRGGARSPASFRRSDLGALAGSGGGRAGSGGPSRGRLLFAFFCSEIDRQ